MPIYEEKLISPLAVRFTQQRIRTTFRDNREVEATIKQITARPGVGGYDIILDAPFPTIEIVRYSPNGRKVTGEDHWFTFDNRRLYCLQRIAAAYWPKRVGAIVEVLYADSGTIRKKLDTMTYGLSVSIGHAFATANELKDWTWRDAVQEGAVDGCHASVEAEAAVLADDAKTSVSDLMEAPGVPSAFERLLAADSKVCDIPEPETCAAEEHGNASVEDDALTSLMGQLLVRKTESASTSPQNSVDALDTTDSTRSPCGDESSRSGSETHGTPVLPVSCAASSEPDLVFAEVEQDCAAPTLKQKRPAKRAAKLREEADAHMVMAEKHQAAWELQAMQLQMAQDRMAQWQLAQWQAAQMAQYQYAAACQSSWGAQW